MGWQRKDRGSAQPPGKGSKVMGEVSAGGRSVLGSRGISGALFAIYAVVLVWAILFKMQVSLDVFGTMRSVNVVPLAGALVVNGEPDYSEVVQNLVAFVPFGLYMGMLLGKRPLAIGLAFAAATSLAFEVLQFAFAAGASDATDLIANTLGAAVGLGLYSVTRRIAGSDARARRVCNTVGLCCTLLAVGFIGLVFIANS